MIYRKLGKTGLEVSVLGLGGIPIQRVDEETAVEIILECKKQGINFIDTAAVYGSSEEYIGKGLKAAGRDSFYIASKDVKYTYDEMKKGLEESLKRLDVEYIDLYQIHNVNKDQKFINAFSKQGALKALIEAKEEGLIKHIGVTSHSLDIMLKAIENDHIETIQFPFNPVETQGEDLFRKAIEKNIGTIGMKPIAGGAFTNVSLSLRYIVNSGLIDVVIPGMDSIDQINENALAVEKKKELSQDEKNMLQKEVDELGNNFCRRCGYCAPCPENIDIPTLFILKGYYDRYNLQDWAVERYGGLSVKASDCIKCGVCEERCPYDLSIREMIVEVKDTFEK